MARAFVVALATVLAAAGCGGESQTHTVQETKDVFGRHGFALQNAHWFGDSPIPEESAILAPPRRGSFSVVVTTDVEADYAWPDFERLQDEDSFDARRANVAVFSDDGLSGRERGEILAALDALPDRGEPVIVAGAS